LARLSPAQRDQFTLFVNKATGWFTVAAGAALLAAGQTWQLTRRYHWPVWLFWLFWLLIIVMPGAAVLNTAVRMIGDGQPGGVRRTARG
jgi:cation transport ATPase